MDSLHDFYYSAQKIAALYGQRYGQALFNRLCEVRPELAEQVRATDMDPFYVTMPQDPRLLRFIEFIEANWNRGQVT